MLDSSHPNDNCKPLLHSVFNTRSNNFSAGVEDVDVENSESRGPDLDEADGSGYDCSEIVPNSRS